jgi:hypothetical protein
MSAMEQALGSPAIEVVAKATRWRFTVGTSDLQSLRSVAMKLTGHKSEIMYRRYAIVSEPDLSTGSQS